MADLLFAPATASDDWFPASMIPRYNLVSFSTVPYVEARQQGLRVDAVIRLAVAAGLMFVLLVLGVVGVMRLPFALLAALVVWFFLSETPRPRRG